MVRWCCPPPRGNQDEYDGASLGNPGNANSGGIVPNDSGDLLLAFHAHFGVNSAEFMAPAEGLHLPTDMVSLLS